MATKKALLSLNPHAIDDHAWWYEEPHGVTFVVKFHDARGRYVATEMRTLAWGSLRAALRRRDNQDEANMRGKRTATV